MMSELAIKAEQKIARMRAEGRGMGEGATYKPGIEVTDFSSLGVTSRVWSDKTGRTHHLLSRIEQGYFYLFEGAPNVLDINEQWPLWDRDLSQATAKALGVRHPTYPRTNVPVPLTIDFRLKVAVGDGTKFIGVNTKSISEADDPRSMEKLALAKACLAQLGMEHHLLFDTQLPKNLVNNLVWIRSARALRNEPFPFDGYLAEMTERFRAYLVTTLFDDRPLATVCGCFDQLVGQPLGTGVRVARLMLDTRELRIDLTLPHLQRQPLYAFQLAPVFSTTAALR